MEAGAGAQGYIIQQYLFLRQSTKQLLPLDLRKSYHYLMVAVTLRNLRDTRAVVLPDDPKGMLLTKMKKQQ